MGQMNIATQAAETLAERWTAGRLRASNLDRESIALAEEGPKLRNAARRAKNNHKVFEDVLNDTCSSPTAP